MKQHHNTRIPRAIAIALAALVCPTIFAQERAAPELKPQCQAVVATVLVSLPTCTAALCNTGTSQGGWTGLVAMALNRQSIDAASFSVGVGAMLSTALKQTGCFEVFDGASVEELRKEAEAAGKTPPAMPSADYVVRASVTQADLVVDETTIVFYKKTSTTASLTLDTKLVASTSGAVFDAGSYDAKDEKTSQGLPGIYTTGNDSRKNTTPFSDVARDAVTKAAVGLTAKILAQGGSAGAKVPPAAAPQPQAVPVAASAAQ